MAAHLPIARRLTTALALLLMLLFATPLAANTDQAVSPWTWLTEIWSQIIEWLDPNEIRIAPPPEAPTDSMGFEIEPNG